MTMTENVEVLNNKRAQDIEEDYELARDTLHFVLNTAKEIIPTLRDVAKESESPRAFEVLSKMLKDTADVANTTLDNQRKKQVVDTESALEMIRAREEQGGPPLLEARVIERRFIGSVEDMQERMAKRLEKENDEAQRDNSESSES